MDSLLDEKCLKDLQIIKEEMEPVVLSLEKKEVDMFSLTLFLSSFVKNLLEESNDKKKKEIILRHMLD